MRNLRFLLIDLFETLKIRTNMIATLSNLYQILCSKIDKVKVGYIFIYYVLKSSIYYNSNVTNIEESIFIDEEFILEHLKLYHRLKHF